MKKLATLYSLSWDHENGCGCEVYPTEAERDGAFRGALASFARSIAIADLPLNDLLAMFESSDFTGGARFTCRTHTVELPID